MRKGVAYLFRDRPRKRGNKNVINARDEG